MDEVTRILSAIERGDALASEQLLPAVYDALRQFAARRLARERPGKTLQATALVHEAYLRLVGPDGYGSRRWDGRGHFFAAAAEAMRRILVEDARRKKAIKRGGALDRREVDAARLVAPDSKVDVIALDEALGRLAARDAEAARLVSLRFFGGLTMPEAAETLGLSVRTAERIWAYARAFLRTEMGPPDG
jgi:RNA polymerase sigma factor (TIGR02999 family)